MNPYLKFVMGIELGVEAAKSSEVSGVKPAKKSDSKVVLFSPHPDDECITGLLPLRLMAELDKEVINVPVTFGSNPERQAGRAKELADACGFLGWEMYGNSPDYQSLEIDDVVGVLDALRPDVIFFPHSNDWNSRHIATHHLVMKALEKMPDDFSCMVVETEFWGAMDDPNLMVEGNAELVADLVGATSLHVGEVTRNPYHLMLPAWMQDNVRRGGELVGGQGGEVPDFSFATLYRLNEWKEGQLFQRLEQGTVVPMGARNLKEIF